MRLWRLLSRRMVAKVFLAIGIAVSVLLLIQSRVETQREVRRLEHETLASAQRIAYSLIGSVEHSMLRGDGIDVKALIRGLKERLSGVEIEIYDRRGIEVFAPAAPAPDPAALPEDVAGVLAERARRTGPGGRVVSPIRNERRCAKCHDDEPALRGVLALDIEIEACLRSREEILARIVTAGFIHVMTARREDILDRYFSELARSVPHIRETAVFDADSDLRYGAPIANVGAAEIAPLLQRGAAPRYVARDDDTLALVPLVMTNRCVACHSDELGATRGVLAVSLDTMGPASDYVAEELEQTIETSLRYIMLSALGRRIADFLDAVAATGAVRGIQLYDNVGRLFWTTNHPAPPPEIAKVLSDGESVYRLVGRGDRERLIAVEPLRSEEACVRCHGAESKMLGAVSVGLSTAGAAAARADRMRSRVYFTAATLLGILLILAVLLQYLVARPVKHIGDVAEAVGEGNLSVTVARADENGDEVARLGQRINEMVRGLRAKMNLEKFVSKGAAEAAAGAGLRGVARRGERRAATVLFSDIRGFTAYSEQVAPETVVEMLNRFLQAQAEVVVAHGGDIDKFVGDELMAVFHGEDGASAAVRCAAAMLDAVHACRERGERLTVGIGIATGDVVYGAIGHEDRMDFTVIGDVVNTGARLCSAAGPNEILVSAPVRDAAGEVGDALRFEPGEPLALKGKREPLPVFAVHKA